MLVMLKKSWSGNFNRAVRDKKGEVKKLLDFAPGIPVELTEEEHKAVEADIGIALLPIRIDEKSRPRVISDEDPEPEDQTDQQPDDQTNQPNIYEELDALGIKQPQQKALAASGLTTFEALDAYRKEHPLEEIKGIGVSSAASINEALDKALKTVE